MGYEDAKRVQVLFKSAYMFKGPLAEYMECCAVATRATAERFLGGKWREADMAAIRQGLTDAGEDPDEWCLLVGLREELPEGLALPENYGGLRVMGYIVGIYPSLI